MAASLLKLAEYRLASMRRQIYACAGPCPELYSSLRNFGLDLALVEAHAGIYAIILARFWGPESGDSMFDFDIDGAPAAVIEALLYDGRREQYVADLVAWPLHDPTRFATALGPPCGADVLGVEHMVMRGERPLRVFPTPLQWMQAGCQGCVPLTEAGGRYWLLKAGGPFLVGSLEEGRWLREYLGYSVARHDIRVPMENRRAA